MQYVLYYDLVVESKDWSRPLEDSTISRDEGERVFDANDDAEAIAQAKRFLADGESGPKDLSKPRYTREFKQLLAVRYVEFRP